MTSAPVAVSSSSGFNGLTPPEAALPRWRDQRIQKYMPACSASADLASSDISPKTMRAVVRSGRAGSAVFRAASEGFPGLLVEDQPGPGWVFGVAYRDDAARGGRDLDARAVAAAVAGGAPASAGRAWGAHVRTPSPVLQVVRRGDGEQGDAVIGPQGRRAQVLEHHDIPADLGFPLQEQVP